MANHLMSRWKAGTHILPNSVRRHICLSSFQKYLSSSQHHKYSGGDWFIWIDAGLSRHVDHFGDEPWPTLESITSLHTSSVYVSSWNGYGEATDAWIEWCKSPAKSFRENRNLLAGTVIFASKQALPKLLPLWSFIFEKLALPTSPWNNEQVVFSLIGCALPNLVGVIDSRSLPVLWKTMQAHKGIANISRVPMDDSFANALCDPWQ